MSEEIQLYLSCAIPGTVLFCTVNPKSVRPRLAKTNPHHVARIYVEVWVASVEAACAY